MGVVETLVQNEIERENLARHELRFLATGNRHKLCDALADVVHVGCGSGIEHLRQIRARAAVCNGLGKWAATGDQLCRAADDVPVDVVVEQRINVGAVVRRAAVDVVLYSEEFNDAVREPALL